MRRRGSSTAGSTAPVLRRGRSRRAGSGERRRPATSSRRWSDVTFEEAIAFALSLPGTELGTSYGKPAVKVAANGRAFLFPSHEAESSFGVAMDLAAIALLKE